MRRHFSWTSHYRFPPRGHIPSEFASTPLRPNKVVVPNSTPPPPSSSSTSQPSTPISVSYVRPVVFGTTAIGLIFVAAGVEYDKNQTTFWHRLLEKHRHRLRFPQLLGRGGEEDDKVTMAEVIEEKRIMMMEKKRELLERVQRRLEQYELIPRDLRRLYLLLADKYASLSESEKTLLALVGINAVVFGLWQSFRWQGFMMKWFMHHPGKLRSITLVTSCFSHQDPMHFLFNMVGLYSFGMVIHDRLGREQFLAMYLGTGIAANVVSHVVHLTLRRTRPLMPGLGASGAVFGLLGATALWYPHSSVSLIFLPMVPIKMR